eukprot:TRINITY_DN2465_c0_g1_i1.p1 TRINITY_DN2465_c0_g1~~TRINITY_DN2465_c0_g1_i1.p1  ORF type:complete len:366 (+),score=120.76 TRINITY_DN2465_c0_g1_i1:35-1132(+)
MSDEDVEMFADENINTSEGTGVMEVDDSRFSNRYDRENLPWVEKYRPAQLSDLVSQDDIISTVERLVQSNRLPHLLLYGPPGTGKTSTALAISRLLNGSKRSGSMTLELNASDARGIAVVRDKIKSFASTQQIFQTGLKFIILDEADSMTSAAQFSLRRIMEKYTKTTRFCIICNYVNKVIPALQSRCTKFRFSPLAKEDITTKLREVASKEGVNLTDAGLKGILHLSGGDMRRCLNIMQACHMAYSEVDERNVYLCTGNATPEEVRGGLGALLNFEFTEAFKHIQRLQVEKGFALSDMVRELHIYVLHMSDLPDEVLRFLLEKLAELEYDLSHETSQHLQTGALVSIFQIARLKVIELVTQASE